MAYTTINKNGYDMKVTLLNPNTKKAQTFIHNYKYTINKYCKHRSVLDVYENPSQAKIKSEEFIHHLMGLLDGFGYYVTGFNCMQYTAMWLLNYENKTYLIIETKDNRYMVLYDYE